MFSGWPVAHKLLRSYRARADSLTLGYKYLAPLGRNPDSPNLLRFKLEFADFKMTSHSLRHSLTNKAEQIAARARKNGTSRLAAPSNVLSIKAPHS